jgi:hypothetical protein
MPDVMWMIMLVLVFGAGYGTREMISRWRRFRYRERVKASPHRHEPVVTQSNETNENDATGRATQRGFALLFILGAAAALFAFLYLTPD